MIQCNKKIVLSIICICLIAAYIIVKWQGSPFVEYLYQNDQLDLLNIITNNKGNSSLEFYLGRTQETLWGPLSQVISGLLLTGCVLLFFRDISWRRFSFVIFGFLLLTKGDVLFFPPYGDAIGGPFAEALWLSRNSFDYGGLAHQAGYAAGGPKVYLFSIYPTYLAILLKNIPDIKTFLVVNHLIVFMMASVVVALLREIMKKIFPSDLASLSSIILVALPLFQSQVEAINMELPSTFFIVLSAYALVERRAHLAGISAILALLIKGTGVVACLSYFVVSLLFLCGFIEERNFALKVKTCLWGGILFLVSLLKVSLKFFINDQHVSAGMVKFGVGWPSLYKSWIFYFYIISFLVFLFSIIQKNRTAEKFSLNHRGGYVHSIMFIFGGMWFVLFLNFFAVSPRYRIAVYPFLVYCLLFLLSVFMKSQVFRRAGLVFIILVACFASYGCFYPSLLDNDHVLLERSLEYRNDLEVNRRIVQALEQKYSKFYIGAPFILAQLLAIPEFGYVSKDLDVMIYGFECTYDDINSFPGIKNLDIGKTLYVGVKVAELNEDLSYPIHPHDLIIEEIQYGDKKAWLFMGGISLDSVFRATRMIKLRNALGSSQQGSLLKK